jgi:hypothetical protein
MADCETHSFLDAGFMAPLDVLAGYDQAAAIAELDDMADRELVAYWRAPQARARHLSLGL